MTDSRERPGQATERVVETVPWQWRRLVAALGPGVVSGAADVDPTTVATLAVIGAGTVYGLAWLTLLLLPMIAVVLVISTHVGATSGRDLQTAVADGYGRLPQWLLLVSILAVNIVTIGADLEGGAAAVGLLAHVDWRWFVLPLSLVLLTALTLGGYEQVQRALKYVLLCLLAYAAAAVFAHPDWGAVIRGSLVPHFGWRRQYGADALSLVGTTVTSYVYIWQTIAQGEERLSGARPRASKLDAIIGSFFAVAVFWFILVATGATLGVHHLHANTAAEAAQALRPVAGSLAEVLFALGLLASAVVALPVLIATTAYVTGAQMQTQRGLSLKVREAPVFYGALGAAALLGTVVALSGIAPIRLLFIAGIIGGIATPLGLIMLLAVGGNHKLTGGRPVPRRLLVVGWTVTAIIAVLSLTFIIQQLSPGPRPPNHKRTHTDQANQNVPLAGCAIFETTTFAAAAYICTDRAYCELGEWARSYSVWDSDSSSARSSAMPSPLMMLPPAATTRAVPTIGATAAKTPWTCSAVTPISPAAARFIRYEAGGASTATRAAMRTSNRAPGSRLDASRELAVMPASRSRTGVSSG